MDNLIRGNDENIMRFNEYSLNSHIIRLHVTCIVLNENTDAMIQDNKSHLAHSSRSIINLHGKMGLWESTVIPAPDGLFCNFFNK